MNIKQQEHGVVKAPQWSSDLRNTYCPIQFIQPMWMSRQIVDNIATTASCGTCVAVAVPACNEAQSIEACIRALDMAAASVGGATIALVVLVNNSSDDTAAIARAYRASALSISVVEVSLAPNHAHAGGARRAAFEHALTLLPPDGVLMTTDADSIVDHNWINANLVEIARGADAVAGVVAFDPEALAALSDKPLRALEWQLAGLHARLATLIDPRAHDPWPNHIWAWGASLAVTVSAYRQIGGLPSIPLAEDRALAEAIETAGLKLRHSHAPVVYTSPRQNGRAPGGFADLLHRYQIDDAAPCDAALEPTATFMRRLIWRSRLRQLSDSDGVAAAANAARRIGFKGSTPVATFGNLWKAVETEAALLARRRIDPATLVDEVAYAHRMIKRIERRATGPFDIRASALVE